MANENDLEINDASLLDSEANNEATETPTVQPADVVPPVDMGLGRNRMPLPRTLPPITDADFIKERIDEQLTWYDQKSRENQRQFRKYKRIEFAVSASVPVLVTFIGFDFGITDVATKETVKTLLQILAAIGGITAVFATKMIELNDFYNYWISYRITCEALRNEKYKYLSHAEPYDEEDAFPRLVSSVDAILNKETQKWGQKTQQKQSTKDKNNSGSTDTSDIDALVAAAIARALKKQTQA